MLDGNQGFVYYPQDYASFSRRIGIIAIDCATIVLLTILLSYVFAKLGIESDSYWVLGCYFLLPTFYMTVVKSSPVRTLGYRAAGVKIVTYQGTKPGFSIMLLRFLVSLVGPFQLPLDILWIFNDPNKQSLRDKLAGTYIIKQNARQLGQGDVKTRYYFILGFCLIFKEVDRKYLGASNERFNKS